MNQTPTHHPLKWHGKTFNLKRLVVRENVYLLPGIATLRAMCKELSIPVHLENEDGTPDHQEGDLWIGNLPVTNLEAHHCHPLETIDLVRAVGAIVQRTRAECN